MQQRSFLIREGGRGVCVVAEVVIRARLIPVLTCVSEHPVVEEGSIRTTGGARDGLHLPTVGASRCLGTVEHELLVAATILPSLAFNPRSSKPHKNKQINPQNGRFVERVHPIRIVLHDIDKHVV